MQRETAEVEVRAVRRKARVATLDALSALGGRARRNDVREWALLHGGFSEAELTAPAPVKGAHKHHSLVDHQLSWALTDLRRDGLVSNPARGVWQLAGEAREAPRPVAAPVTTTRMDALRAMPYREYLRSPEWRETRAAALVRAGHACSLDATHVEHLEVHHRSYTRLGAELAQDIVVLCRDCHRLHHRANGRPGPRDPAPASAGPPSSTPVVDTTHLYIPDSWGGPRKRSLWQRLTGT